MESVYIAIVGLLGTLVTVGLPLHFKHSAINKKMSDTDNKQNELIQEIKNDVKDIKTIYKKEIFRQSVRKLILDTTAKVISNNALLKNKEFINILTTAKKEMLFIFDNLILYGFNDFNAQAFDNDITAVFKCLKHSIDYEKLNVDKTFISELNKVVVIPLTHELVMRLSDFYTGMYNGQSETKFKIIVREFIENIIIKSIEHYQSTIQIQKRWD